MKKRNLILTALVFALILCASIQPAIAYFTTYVRTEGGYPISVGDTTTIEEKFSGWTKEVTIKNKAGSEPVFVRAKVIYKTKNNELGYAVTPGKFWSKEPDADGYYYYNYILYPETEAKAGGFEKDENGRNKDGRTTPFLVEITKIPENPQKDDTFSVTVVYESTPVRYNANKQAYADWNAKIIDIGSTTGGNG